MSFPEELQKYSDDFDELCRQRHEMGAEKYGPVNFLEANTLQMMIEEIIDMANYARYSYIKLRILETRMGQSEDIEMPGIQGWRKN